MFTYPVGLINPNVSGIPRDGLIGEWLFDGNANDTSGNGNDGTVSGATLTTDRYSVADSAYLFDSIDKISLSNPDILNIDDTAWSVSMWLYSDDVTKRADLISKMDPANPYSGWSIRQSQTAAADYNKKITALIQYTSAAAIRVAGSTVLSDSTWYHVVFTYDGSGDASGVKIYIDSVRETEYIGTDSLGGDVSNTVNCNIGQIGGVGSGLNFEGKLDDTRIYNRVLTDEEITALYNE